MTKHIKRLPIYCCQCQSEILARLTDGSEIYPHRPDLFSLPFWKCDGCGNFVGCHYKTKNRTTPLGVIPTPRIREMRKRIHAIIDPIWRSGKTSRSKVYHMMGTGDRPYHTAEIRTEDEADEAMAQAKLVVEWFKRPENQVGD